jgi:uncharacterized RDD family membrane protein YckC
MNWGLKVPLWKRVFAYIIDILIISLVLAPLSSFSTVADLTDTSSWSDTAMFSAVATYGPQFIIFSIIVAVLTLLYWALLEYYTKQSIGKMLFKIQVKSKGKQLRLNQCLIRNVSKISSLLLLIDVIYMLVKKKNQRFFDKLANTEVVNK